MTPSGNRTSPPLDSASTERSDAAASRVDGVDIPPGLEATLLDRLAADIVASLRRGERPSAAELTPRYPELAGSVESYIRSLTLLEESSSRRHGPTVLAQPADPFSRQLGDFRLLRELGRGGMGIVYEAEQVSLNRRVAIKVLPRSPLFNQRTLTRFEREATAAARLHHSNIVPVFGLGEQDGVRYFVMQCIDGSGLDDVIPEAESLLHKMPRLDSRVDPCQLPTMRRDARTAAAWLVSPPEDNVAISLLHAPSQTTNRPPSPPDDGAASTGHYCKNVARIGLQIAEALAYAHRHDVLHRDLKPANVLLDDTGHVWLADFGLAKLLEDEALTESGDLVGTIRYSPPESFQGEYDARSDLYQLGLTLYELLTFRPAVRAANHPQAIEAVLREQLQAPRKLQPHVPRDLETIVMKCLAYEPDRRYASAELLASDLRRFLHDRPIQARRIGAVERTWRWCRRNRAVASLTGLSVLLLLLIGVVSTASFFREARLRREADTTTETALSALDRVYMAFVPNWSTIGEAAESGSLTASSEVAQLLEELVQFYDKLAAQSNDETDGRSPPEAVRALRRVGQIYVRLGNFEKAKETYGRAVQRLGGLRAANDLDVALERARVFNDLGIVYWANREIEESYESHKVAEDLLNRRDAAGSLPASDDWQFELARTWYLLGRQARGRFGGVPLRPVITRSAEIFDLDFRSQRREEVLASAVELLEPLAARTMHPEHRHLLAVCYREHCNPMLLRDGRPVDPTILKSIEILEHLIEEYPEHLGYRYSLCLACHWYTIPFEYDSATLPAALQRSERGLAIAQELAQQAPQEWIFRAIQVDILLQMTVFLKRYEQPDAALAACRRATDLAQMLWEQYRFPAFGYWLGNVRLFEGDALTMLQQSEEAVQAYQRSIELLDLSLVHNPHWGHVVYRDLKDAWNGLTTNYSAMDRGDEAAAAQEKARRFLLLYESALASRE
ncbi:MAG: serine/threonine protein kinase [Planctomycetaceae bacterium]|nr:serine/threonine protein kinase [Planctomycetaceae bacterium]